jgi:hypothetical protein
MANLWTGTSTIHKWSTTKFDTKLTGPRYLKIFNLKFPARKYRQTRRWHHFAAVF